MSKVQQDYASLNAELDEVMNHLQQPDIQVDEAVKLYEKGLRLADQLETHVQEAENKVQQLQLQHDAKG